ncbi:MAG: glyoxalase [Eubacteriales bacterium]|nr:glyoxalase [Eubacteriales bacterium]
MQEYDDAVLDCFLENQGQLFPDPVAETREAAEYFLEDCMAVVAESAAEVLQYFEEIGTDIEGEDEKSILEADEVFEVGDGRYLIVEG